jgi:hypothetical protein
MCSVLRGAHMPSRFPLSRSVSTAGASPPVLCVRTRVCILFVCCVLVGVTNQILYTRMCVFVDVTKSSKSFVRSSWIP